MSDETEVKPEVFEAIAKVRTEINGMGVDKGDKASGGGISFNFRGIDRTLNAFSGPMMRADLMMVPSYSDLVIEQRKTANGVTYHAQVIGSYKLMSTKDGSSIDIGNFFGEANDTQDKAIAKAQSIALRQAYLQTFIVPLGPEYDPESTDQVDGDADDTKPQSVPRKVEGQLVDKQSSPAPVTEITKNQETILRQKLKSKGLTVVDFKAQFGKVDSSNINKAMEWVKNYKPADPDA